MSKTNFKTYYADPEFRQKHLQNLTSYVICECGLPSQKVNLQRHMRTKKHKKAMEKKKQGNLNENTLNMLIRLRKQAKKMTKEEIIHEIEQQINLFKI